MLTSQQVKDFADKGYFIVHNGFSPLKICEMKTRLEDIILGKFEKSDRRFQVEKDSAKYEDVNHTDASTSNSTSGPDVAYRKISDLEYDEIYLKNLQCGWIKEICTRLLGEVVSIMRVTMMNKPAQSGTPLPWHQDCTVNWPTTVQPELAIWFPLDDASSASGTLQIIPKSHNNGMIGNGHMLAPEKELQYAPDSQIVDVEIKAGDCLFFHPALLHRSGVNRTDTSRRAINVILMAGAAKHIVKNSPYPLLFGDKKVASDSLDKTHKVPG